MYLMRFMVPLLLAVVVGLPGVTKAVYAQRAQVVAHRLAVPDSVMESAEATVLQSVRNGQGALNINAISFQNNVPLCPVQQNCNRTVAVTYSPVGETGNPITGNGTDETEHGVNVSVNEVHSKIKITVAINEGAAPVATRSEILRISRFAYDPYVKTIGIEELATQATASSPSSLSGCGAANTSACAPLAVQPMDDTHVHVAPVCSEQWDWSCTNAPPPPIADNFQDQRAPNLDQAQANGWSR